VTVEGDPVRVSMCHCLAPTISVWEERRHPWVAVPDGAERLD
jgi:hypothetical protein